MNIKRRCSAHVNVWVVLVTAVAALAGGWALGWHHARANSQRGPSMQKVMDDLSAPLPIPAGAKLIKIFSFARGRGEGTVSWGKGLALDATSMTPNDITSLRDIYCSHFQKLFFPKEQPQSGNVMDLFKLAAPDEFELAVGGGWTWHWRGGYSGKHFDLDMDAQVFDFKQDRPDSSHCSRVPVQLLSEPVQGQRIIWIRLNFKGRDLIGQGNWPAETLPATTTSQ